MPTWAGIKKSRVKFPKTTKSVFFQLMMGPSVNRAGHKVKERYQSSCCAAQPQLIASETGLEGLNKSGRLLCHPTTVFNRINFVTSTDGARTGPGRHRELEMMVIYLGKTGLRCS